MFPFSVKTNLLSLSSPTVYTASGFGLHTCFPALPTLQSALVIPPKMNSSVSGSSKTSLSPIQLVKPNPVWQFPAEGPCHLFLQVNDMLLRILLEKGETGRRGEKGGEKAELNFTDTFYIFWGCIPHSPPSIHKAKVQTCYLWFLYLYYFFSEWIHVRTRGILDLLCLKMFVPVLCFF